MVHRCCIILFSFISLMQPCLADDQPVFTRYSIKGSSSEWVYHACGFSFPNGAPQTDQQISELSPYLAYIQSKLKRTWDHPGTGRLAEGKLFTVMLDISKEGKLSNVGIGNSSGFAETDDSLIKAVKKLAPLRPLPTGFSDIQLTLMFDYSTENKK